MMKESRAYARLRQTKSRSAENYHNEDLRLESMIPYVQGKLPIYVHANGYAKSKLLFIGPNDRMLILLSLAAKMHGGPLICSGKIKSQSFMKA